MSGAGTPPAKALDRPRRSIKRQQAFFAELPVVKRRDLHHKIVWMLAVNDRLSKRGLANLKKLRILTLRNCRRLKTQHYARGQLPRANFALRHRHEPVRRKELVAATRSSLLKLIGERHAMKHKLPAIAFRHPHRVRRRSWLDVGPRSGAHFYRVD